MSVNLDNPQNTVTVPTKRNTVTENEIVQIKEAVNQYQLKNNRRPINFKNVDRAKVTQSYKSVVSNKAFNGQDVANGSGLANRTEEALTTLYSDGGAFINSGVDYRPNTRGVVYHKNLRLQGSYKEQICGTPVDNELSVFSDSTQQTQAYTAYMEGCEDVLVNTEDPAYLMAEMKFLLENEKLVLSDTLAAEAVTGNPQVVALNPQGANSERPIRWAMGKMMIQITPFKMRSRLRRRGASVAKFYMSLAGFSAFMQETASDGQPLANSAFVYASPDQSIPESGLVGRYSGHDVIIVTSEPGKGILSSYDTNTTGSITSQEGGTNPDKTAILYGIPAALTILRGPAEGDYISVFDGKNDKQMFEEAEVLIGARTYMSAKVTLPLFWTYFAFTA